MPIINSKLYKECEFIFPHLTDNTFNSKEAIDQSDLFIAEVSRASLGLGIEIGRAEMSNKRILCIYNEKNNVSSCIEYINADVIGYKNSEDMISKITEYIHKLKCYS